MRNKKLKIIFLCRNSVGAKYIANVLAVENEIHGIVIEEGKAAKKRKLKRIFKKTSWFNYPSMLLDLIFLALYARIANLRLNKQIIKPNNFFNYPKGVPIYKFDDANESHCINLLKSLEPDIIIVLGTSILKQDVINIPKRHIFNIHGGIVPQYRNVHSDFWALYNNDYGNIGVTIMYLDSGIDSGAIALQENITIGNNDSILDIKVKNLKLMGDLVIKLAENIQNNSLSRVNQPDTDYGFYKTPAFTQILKIIFKTINL